MLDPVYMRQAALLVRCLPEIGKHSCFALKGGTAINLFVRPMPRLSVDIDLTYLPLSPRDEALSEITRAMECIAGDVTRRIVGASVHVGRLRGTAARLVVAGNDVQIKIEANLVLRGNVYRPEVRDLCVEAQTLFEQFVSARTLSFADLYGGKICAALDRQHPRDLYDILLLLKSEGLTSQVRRAFVVYLASHDRPMHELLDPQFKDLAEVHMSEFAGMVREEVSVDMLGETRRQMVDLLRRGLDADAKRFLVSMKEGKPEWDALGIPHLRSLPALQWKLQNIQRMDRAKRDKALRELRRVLDI